MTELHDHLKLLFAKIGVLHCRQCGKPVQRASAESVATELLERGEGTRVLVTFTVPLPENLPWSEARAGLVASGFRRLMVGRDVVEVESVEGAEKSVVVVADRLVARADQKRRVCDSLEQAFRFGKGRLQLLFPDDGFASASYSELLGARRAASATASRPRTCSPSTARSAPARVAAVSGARSTSTST